jgi:hypothetical protein
MRNISGGKRKIGEKNVLIFLFPSFLFLIFIITEMTQEIRELKKQLKALNTSTPSTPGGADNAVIEELRQNLEKETIERLLKEDDLAKVRKELETFKKQTEEEKSGNKEIKEITTRLRAVEDEKVILLFIIY